jgi:hypothetical protein
VYKSCIIANGQIWQKTVKKFWVCLDTFVCQLSLKYSAAWERVLPRPERLLIFSSPPVVILIPLQPYIRQSMWGTSICKEREPTIILPPCENVINLQKAQFTAIKFISKVLRSLCSYVEVNNPRRDHHHGRKTVLACSNKLQPSFTSRPRKLNDFLHPQKDSESHHSAVYVDNRRVPYVQ